MLAFCCASQPTGTGEIVDTFPATAKDFQMQVVGVRGISWLPSEDNPGCYIEVARAGTPIFTSTVIKYASHPMWTAAESSVQRINEGDALTFKLYGQESASFELSRTNCLGTATIEHAQFAQEGFNDEVLLEGTGDGMQAYLHLKIKAAGKEYPAVPPLTFTVEVEKGDRTELGLKLDTSDGKNLMVFAVDSGAFANYNTTADPSKKLMKSDFIVSVNEASSQNGCITQMKQSSVVKCVFTRGIELSVILEREEQETPLGLEFPDILKTHSLGLPITKVAAVLFIATLGMVTPLVKLLELVVTEGAAKTYNDACGNSEGDKLRVHDRILSVMGETGAPADVKEKMENARGQFQIRILRPCSDHAPLLESTLAAGC